MRAGQRELSLRLPATSANLGPGFDTLALALDVYLEIKACEADTFSIQASGRSPEICGGLERNLLLDVYRKTLVANGRDVVPLSLQVRNGIPLGIGCGAQLPASPKNRISDSMPSSKFFR